MSWPCSLHIEPLTCLVTNQTVICEWCDHQYAMALRFHPRADGGFFLDTETDCPNCSRVLHVHDLCECDHELGPYCGPCCRAYHQERP